MTDMGRELFFILADNDGKRGGTFRTRDGKRKGDLVSKKKGAMQLILANKDFKGKGKV